jgi:hypothetical protein
MARVLFLVLCVLSLVLSVMCLVCHVSCVLCMYMYVLSCVLLLVFSLLGVWVNGKVTAIKHSKRGRSTKMVPRYVLEFEDRERTQYECGYAQVVEYIEAYTARINTAARSDRSTMDARSLLGSTIFTMWTLTLNHLAGNGERPEWLKKVNGIWLRKCTIARYHNTLSQYELHYTCGYIRYVDIA